jgi:hypothetical protein
MRVYSGTTKSLIEDSTFNRIAPKLKDAFFNEFRYQPSVAEVNSWNNSLRAISQVFQTASFLDHGVLLELQLPLTSKRLDCLVTGYDSKKAPSSKGCAPSSSENGGCARAGSISRCARRSAGIRFDSKSWRARNVTQGGPTTFAIQANDPRWRGGDHENDGQFGRNPRRRAM